MPLHNFNSINYKQKISHDKRIATINRKTKETNVELTINIDGSGNSSINTGIGFLDHMPDLLTKHGLFDLTIRASGDRSVDDHHTVEGDGNMPRIRESRHWERKRESGAFPTQASPCKRHLLIVAMVDQRKTHIGI